MKKVFFYYLSILLACLTLLVILNSCDKDSLDSQIPKKVVEQGISIRNLTTTQQPTVIGNKIIVLGNKISNPYNIVNIRNAQQNIDPTNLTKVSATDLYIKFSPQNYEELKNLQETDIYLTDYPQDFEILEEGQLLFDIQNNSIPEYYAYVPISFTFPTGNYEILEELNFNITDAYVEIEAFKISGNEEELHGFKTNFPPNDIFCNFPCFPAYDENKVGDGAGRGDGWYCDCSLVVTDTGGEPDPNACDCPSTVWNNRIPAGCIQVFDTQLGLQGVRDVQVIWGNGWGSFRQTTTDENGCFEIEGDNQWDIYEGHGKEIMIVRFRNDRSVIRAIRPTHPLLQYSLAVRDVRTVWGPNFNNMQIVYNPDDTDDWSADKLFWYSAITNNGIHEFHDYCAEENLPPPADDLDVLMTPFNTGAAAPMLDDMEPDVVSAIVAFHTSAIIAACFGEPTVAIAAGVLGAYLAVYAPDIVMNYGGEMTQAGGGFNNSDRIKNTVYHELGHAQHFEANGSSDYWRSNIFYIVWNVIIDNNPSYGNRGDAGSERCAIIETWGNHQGYSITEANYDVNTSLAFGQATQAWHQHIFQLEAFIPDVVGGTGLGIPVLIDDDISWIPMGILHDCFDFLPNPAGVSETITDNVGGYSQLELFNSILGSPQELETVEVNLENSLPPNENIGDLTTLFNEYGY